MLYDAQTKTILLFEPTPQADIERTLGRALTKADTVEYGNAMARVTLTKPLFARVKSYYPAPAPPVEKTPEETALEEIEAAALSEPVKELLRLALQTPDEPEDKGTYWDFIKSKLLFWRK